MRLDKYLVQQGHYPSRSHANAAIKAGLVRANGCLVTKPAFFVTKSETIETDALHPYVSRGGIKLAYALSHWRISLKGAHCIDLGASTGGFTDVLLKEGAQHVYAVDVGRDQLHPVLCADPRVSDLSGTDARSLSPAIISEYVDILVCDMSFISLVKALDSALKLAKPGAHLVGLFKPQFELTPKDIGKGGLVKPRADIDNAKKRLTTFLISRNWCQPQWTPSPITGGDGNTEFLFYSQYFV